MSLVLALLCCAELPSRVYATAINALTFETYYRYVKFFGEQEK